MFPFAVLGFVMKPLQLKGAFPSRVQQDSICSLPIKKKKISVF